MQSTLCETCNAAGLPILPLRYVPVPGHVGATLPPWASAKRVAEVPLGGEYHYALRTLRAGYVYLFYSKNHLGPNRWDCFMVTGDGLLLKQPDPKMAIPEPWPALSCTRQGHSSSRLRHLVIERPEKCGPTWIAFSEHKWSDETIHDYTVNSKLRNARMQTLHPAEMARGAKHSHGIPAEAGALEQVLEYAAAFDKTALPHDGPISALSKPDGSFLATLLSQQSTRAPWSLRTGQAKDDVQAMQQRARKADGTHHTPHLLALWDAIGTVHELNGFRNDAAGWVDLYGHERELQIQATNAIAGIKQALDRKISQGWDQIADNTARMPDFEENGIRTQAVMRYAKSDPADLGRPLYQLDESYKAGQVSEAAYKAQRSQIIGANSNNPAAMEAEYAKIDRHRKELNQARSTNLARNKREDIAHTWAKYQGRIDAQAMETFNAKWSHLQRQADAIIDKRTQVLIKWLEAPLFIDTLEDFHGSNVSDGLLFEDAIGDAVYGISNSASGAAKIEEWVKQAKASVKSNLLWRAVALNQTQGMADVDAALQEALTQKEHRTEVSALTIEGYLAKYLKAFADIYKKAVSARNTNLNAASEKGSKAFGVPIRPVNMRGADKLAVTVGDNVFRYFRVDGLGDYLSEKLIQHMFSIRAFVAPADSVNLIFQQAKEQAKAGNASLSREAVLRRLRTARTFLAVESAAMKKAQSEQLSRAWENFKSTNNDGANAVRDARLALVVMLIEGVNFQKLLAECRIKNDAKSWWSLAASSVTISSALLDVASVPAKNIFGGESWSYQRLKLWGGVLSASAAAIGVGLDVVEAGKAVDKGYTGLGYLYWSKALLGGAGAALTVATTFTYAAPLIERLTGRVAAGVAVRAVSGVAVEIIATRILFMAAGTWVTVGVFGIQCFIWIISDDKLQEWCALSAFGQKRAAEAGFRTAKQQLEKLQEALIEVGLAG